jgi:hypothetical protein
MEKVGARFIKKCFKIHSTIFVFVFQSTELVSEATCQTMLEITTTDRFGCFSLFIQNNDEVYNHKELFSSPT